MLGYLANLWDADSLSPHGICLLWRPELIWTHAVSDGLIGVAYLAISCFLAYLIYRRPDIKFGWVVWCFATFILACGATHFLSILTLWQPDYGLEALVKVVTAIASVATAVLLWPFLPKALAWPSPEQLSAANAALQRSLEERDVAFAKLQAEIAERGRVEAMLLQSQKMEALGQLTGGLAHDYNNLMAIVSMNVARIRRQLDEAANPAAIKSLNHVAAAAERAAVITTRMLTFSRQDTIEQKETNVADVITGMEPLLKDALNSKRELRFDLDAGLPPISLDRGQLENALLNLVLNARDATPEGGLIVVRVRSDDKEGAIGIEVADTGSGMPPDVIKRAFDPFFTTKPVGKGSGLGLSQVFGFAKRLGGRVTIESLLARGTTVRIVLPVGA